MGFSSKSTGVGCHWTLGTVKNGQGLSGEQSACQNLMLETVKQGILATINHKEKEFESH